MPPFVDLVLAENERDRRKVASRPGVSGVADDWFSPPVRGVLLPSTTPDFAENEKAFRNDAKTTGF